MKKLLTLIFVLCSIVGFAQMRGGSQYDPGAVRSNLSNITSGSTLAVANGGTGKTTAAEALAALGGASLNGSSTVAFNASIYNAATGTAAAPAYSFSSTPDTGIYSAGAGLVNISRGGNLALQISSAIDFYDIAGGDRANIYPQAAGNGVNVSSLNNGATAYRPLTFYCATASFLVGNVLIATSTDDGANKLQVNGSMRLIGGAAPAATEGAIYFNSTDKHFYGYNGTGWVQLDN